MPATAYIANFQYKIELADRASSIFFVLRLENMIGKYHGYDITEIELLSPKPRTMTISEDHVALLSNSIDELLNPKTATPTEGRLQPLNSNSISLAKLLKEICVRA